tara:strand:- start:115407 stop:115976 length:570 start_codon:yes stop_codon:yes gene_type:complete
MRDEILKLRSDGKTYTEIQSIVGCSKGTISYHCGQNQKEKTLERLRTYRSDDYVKPIEKETPTCNHCKKEYKRIRKSQRFCSGECHKDHMYHDHLKRWKSGDEKGWTGKTVSLKNFIRKYIHIKYDSKCCKCGWKEIHPVTGNVPVEVNHIDGIATNCHEDNLELLCPNCHSLTFNFRALNENSCRNRK